MKTVLVGDDTDLLVLLCYHASLDTCSLLFKPEPPKNAENISLGYTSCQTATRGGNMHYFFILSLDVIQLLAFMALVKAML